MERPTKGYKIIHPIAKTLICGDVGIGAMEGKRLQSPLISIFLAQIIDFQLWTLISQKSPKLWALFASWQR